MSQREFEAVIGRAIVDQEFRMELFANPTTALAGYDLTEAEVTALRSVDAESLEGCGKTVRPQREIRKCPEIYHADSCTINFRCYESVSRKEK